MGTNKDNQPTVSPTDVQNRTALLVIDVQQGLFERATPVYKAEEVLDNIRAIIERARRAGIDIFFIQHSNKRMLRMGSDAWQYHPKVQPLLSDTVVHKRSGSAFDKTDLQEKLQARGIRTLVITGLATHMCVKATTADAIKRGYHVILVEDGHSNFSKQAETLIDEWNQKLGEMGAMLRKTSQVDFRT